MVATIFYSIATTAGKPATIFKSVSPAGIVKIKRKFYIVRHLTITMKGDMEDKKMCEWCGELPIYIGIYKDKSYTTEEFICKECLKEMDSPKQCLD